MKNEFHGKDINDMLDKAIDGHLAEKNLDAVLNFETHLFNVIMTANSCSYKLDVGKELWLKVGRWSMLIKEYLDKANLERFVSQCHEIYSGQERPGAVTGMMFKDPVRAEKKHRFGGCLLAATFKGEDTVTRKSSYYGLHDSRPTLTFYSRTTYLGYMGILDMAIANRIANLISSGYPNKIFFRWYISSMQFHAFKSLPYMFEKPRLMNILEDLVKHRDKWNKLTPTWKETIKWYAKVVDGYKESGIKSMEVEKYGPLKRVRRRWMEHCGYLNKNIPPSLSIDKLNFSKAI